MKKSELKAMIKEIIQEVGIGSFGFAPIEDEQIEEVSTPSSNEVSSALHDAANALSVIVRGLKKGSKEQKDAYTAFKMVNKLYSEYAG